MDKYIKELQKNPLNGKQLHNLVEGKANLMTINSLKNYDNIDQVLGKYGAVILLYEAKRGYGHWCCLYKKNRNTLFFFDPYGLGPDEQLENNTYSKPYLTYLLNDSRYDVEYNEKDLQKYCKNIATCGKFVAMKLLFRSLPNNKFLNLFLNNQYYDPDFWVSVLMAFL